MKTKTIRFSGWSLFAVLVMLWGAGPARAAGEIGKTIDRSNVQEYKDVLIPTLYKAVERGEFILPTGNLEFEYKHWDKFLEAGPKNAGKFVINDEGDMIDKSGKFPLYNTYGWPFPHIDTKNDPKAVQKLMWNFVYTRYRFMGVRRSERVQWVNNTKGVHRYVLIDGRINAMQGRPPEHAVSEKENPERYAYMELGLIQEPFAFKNVNQLNFDFLDEREIIQHAYVPAIRRSRQTSGASRSDPYLGSDGWQDLTYMWGGKNRTMDWKLIGEKTILVPFTSTKKIFVKQDPDGTMYLKTPRVKYGFDDPGFKGAKWAPVSGVTWVPRKVWVIEQLPKDPYYAWGLQINYLDQETYQIWMKEIHTKSGELRQWGYTIVTYCEAPNGNNSIGYFTDQNTMDVKANHATIDQYENFEDSLREKYIIYAPLSKMPMSLFTRSSFMALSK